MTTIDPLPVARAFIARYGIKPQDDPDKWAAFVDGWEAGREAGWEEAKRRKRGWIRRALILGWLAEEMESEY